MKKRIFLMIALILCTFGSAFADKYYNNESDFYRDFDEAARKYKWCYVVDVFDEGGGSGFAGEFYDEEAFKEEFKSWSYHWFEMPQNYYTALTLTKTLVEVCR